MPTVPRRPSPRRRPSPAAFRRGFTLIEVLIVVTILGILSSVVIQTFGVTSDDARRTAFVTSLRTFADAAEQYRMLEGDYLEDGSTGALPAGFAPYVDVRGWERETPIGGHWDSERDDNGIGAGIGVHFDGAVVRDDAYMTLVDAIGDDGDLTSGGFRKLGAGRFYRVLEE